MDQIEDANCGKLVGDSRQLQQILGAEGSQPGAAVKRIHAVQQQQRLVQARSAPGTLPRKCDSYLCKMVVGMFLPLLLPFCSCLLVFASLALPAYAPVASTDILMSCKQGSVRV